MKRILLFFFFSIYTQSGFSQIYRLTLNTIKETFSETYLICGIPGNDVFPSFDCDVIPKSSSSPTKDGTYFIYYDNHEKFKLYKYDSLSLFLKASFINGKRDGIWQFFTKTGKLKKEIIFSNGEIISWKGWGYHQNGAKFYEAILDQPAFIDQSWKLDLWRKKGSLICYDKKGMLRFKTTFDNKKEETQYLDEKGRLLSENNFTRYVHYQRNYLSFDSSFVIRFTSQIVRSYWDDTTLKKEVVTKEKLVTEKEWYQNKAPRYIHYYRSDDTKPVDSVYCRKGLNGSYYAIKAQYGLNPLGLDFDNLPEGINMPNRSVNIFLTDSSTSVKSNIHEFIKTGEWTDWYDDGTLKGKSFYNSFIGTDLATYHRYYFGELQSKLEFDPRIQYDTVSVFYFPDKTLKHVGYFERHVPKYQNDTIIYIHKSWYKNGQPDSISFYRYVPKYYGELSGEHIDYESPDSNWVWWYENGDIKRKVIFNDRKRYYREWYPDRSLKCLDISYSGTPMCKCELPGDSSPQKFNSNSYNGVMLRYLWYPNHTLKEAVQYISGIKKGTVIRRYDKNGAVILESSQISYPYFGTVFKWQGEYSFDQYEINLEDFKKYLLKDSLNFLKLKKLKIPGFSKIPSGILGKDSISGRSMTINSFYIQQTETSNKQYRTFINAVLTDSVEVLGYDYIMHELYPDTNAVDKIIIATDTIPLGQYFRNEKYDNYPVIGIDHWAAKYYCDWLYLTILRKYQIPPQFLEVRLPYEVEWEYAATEGLGLKQYLQKYPEMKMNLTGQDPYQNTCQVNAFKQNSFKLYNMFGNVSEMCDDNYYDPEKKQPFLLMRYSGINPVYKEEQEPRIVLRGGCFNDTLKSILPFFRSYQPTDTTGYFHPSFYSMKYNPFGMREWYYYDAYSWNRTPFYRKLVPAAGFRPVIMIVNQNQDNYGELTDWVWIE